MNAARGSRRTAGTLPNPIATYAVEDTPFPGQGRSIVLETERSAYVTFPLEALFQRGPRMDRADEGIRVAEAELLAAERHTAREVARAFYRVALAQVAVGAAEENRAAIERLVEYLRVRVGEGASPEADLIRADVERDQTATEVTLADVDLVRARADLQPFLGGPSPPLDSLRVTLAEPSLAGARWRRLNNSGNMVRCVLSWSAPGRKSAPRKLRWRTSDGWSFAKLVRASVSSERVARIR